MADTTKDSDVEALRKDIESLRAELKALTRDVKKASEHGSGNLGDAARAKLGELGEDASDIAHKVAEKGRESAETIGKTVRERPFQSLLVAFAAGLLLTKLLDRR